MMKFRDTLAEEIVKKYSLYSIVALAIALFSFLFAGITFGFWLQFSLSIAGLCVLSVIADKRGMWHLFHNSDNMFASLFWGIITAGVLYGAFVLFRYMAEQMFSFAHSDIASVYKLKNNVHSFYIALLLIFIIGPGEEVFWRGYLQRNFTNRFCFIGVVVSIAAYTAAHVASGNLMLIAAAAVCGTFWSLIFWRYNNIWLNIISHVIWDVSVFILYPLV